MTQLSAEKSTVEFRLPTIITTMIFLLTVGGWSTILYSRIENNARDIELRVMISEYKRDRTIDSISTAINRAEFNRLLNEINFKVSQLNTRR